jgi:trehalose 6-phosphate synthase
VAEFVVCSHRGPFTYRLRGGRVEAQPGSGGVVTALSALLRGGGDVTWLACALSDADRQASREPAAASGLDIRARLIEVPPDLHRSFYDDACITGLGFLFHGLVDLAYTPTFDTPFHRGWAAYREVNRAYAAELLRYAGSSPVLVEDYHLMLVADELRQLGGRRPTAYFHHIPWCPPAYFGMLPAQIGREILGKILSYDTIGFHARKWADAFLDCCERFLPGASCESDRVKWQGREVPLVVAPVQVDAGQLRRVLDGPATAAWRRRFTRRLAGRRALVRVDRVDLWKNIIRGFVAFERLVRDEQIDDVAFIAVLSRSRMHVPEYRRYLAACQAEARRVNRVLNPRGGGPIHLLLADDHSDHSRALSSLAVADAVLVNAVADGLNLVAKESVVAAEGRSRLVLSQTTGVYEELGRWVYGINPLDVQETASSIAAALRAEPGGQPELLAHVTADSPAGWVERRLAPLR